MHKNNSTRFLQSFVAVPLLATTLSMSGSPALSNMKLLALGQNMITSEVPLITTEEALIRKEQAEKIDAYFASRNAPLEGYGAKFVEEAYKNDIDPNLLPAIAMRESTGGRQACKNPNAPNNNFGWFSCKKGFSSVDESIEYISKTLSGNNPKAKHYRDDMTTEQILKKYNPPSVVRDYSKQVIQIMKSIDPGADIS